MNEGEETLGRIGRAVNCMLQNFAVTLVGVRDAALSVSSTATKILAAARHLAEGRRAGSAEGTNTSSAVEAMAASMSQVSKHAKLSADMAHRVYDQLKRSTNSMNASYLGMGKVDEGLITESRSDPKIGMRYYFQPRMCMLQWRHSGLVNYLNRVPQGWQVRLEGLWIG